MKVCTKCNRTYTDDSLAFCLECGSHLQIGQGSSQAAATAVMTPTQFAHQAPTAQMQPNLTTPHYAPPIQAETQTPSYTPAYSEKPSNAGRVTAILCVLLTIGGLMFFILGLFGSAAKIMDNTVVGVFVLLAMFIPGFGTLIGLFSLYRAFRSHDGKGAKKTAVLAILVNLLYIFCFVLLMVYGAFLSLTK